MRLWGSPAISWLSASRSHSITLYGHPFDVPTTSASSLGSRLPPSPPFVHGPGLPCSAHCATLCSTLMLTYLLETR
jgi:hypothetical protein